MRGPVIPALLASGLVCGCTAKDTDSALAGTGSRPGETGADGGTDTGPSPAQACEAVDGAPLGRETCVDAAPCRWQGNQGHGYFGYSVAAGGDFDGDGHPDVAVGAPVQDVVGADGGVLADAGTVTLLSGGRVGEPGGGALASFSGTVPSAQVGTTVLLPGDMDGDGLSELVVGARGEAVGDLTAAGAVWLIQGRSLGEAEEPLAARTRFTGESTLARVGTALGAAGDVDGDGLADLLLQGELRTTTPDGDEVYSSGRAYIVSGSTTLPTEIALADADARMLAEGADDAAGLGLAGGDLDGDGYADVAVGAPYAYNRRGRVYILPGGPDALRGDVLLSDAPVQLSGSSTYGAYGWSIAMGDVTGDGLADLSIGAPLEDPGDTPNAGRVYLHAGSPGALAAGPSLLTTWTGDFDEQQLGTGLHLGADLDGDGTGDLLMGAVSASRGLVTKGGSVYVARGRSDGWPVADARADTVETTVRGAAVKDYLGRATTAADLDADGAAELITGSGYTDTESVPDVGSVYLFWGAPFDE